MKISAYVPCYNNRETLSRALESILEQSVPVDELFVIDDGSTDGSAEVARRMGVTVHRFERNSGRGAARARAMQVARHEIVLGLDATNVLPRTFLQSALPWFQHSEVAAAFGLVTQPGPVDVAGRWRGRHLLRQDAPRELRRDASLATTPCLLRADAVRAVGGFDPTLRAGEDADLGKRLLNAGWMVVCDPTLYCSSIENDSAGRVLERYARWNSHRPMSLRDYFRQIVYSVKVMARQDLAARDPLAVVLSLAAPHYQFIWSRFYKRRSDVPVSLLPEITAYMRASGNAAEERESFETSVIIPTCSRPDQLAHCLRKLPRNAEIIVSDDSPETGTREMIEREFPWVEWTKGPRRGPSANRNNGARRANGKWLAFIDDDCEPSPGWLHAIENGRSRADVVEGKTVCPGRTDHPLEEHVENLTGGVLWSCNFGINRHAFDRLGGFDEDFLEAGGEDMEFAWRVKRHGLRLRFVPDALVIHAPRIITFRKLLQRTLQTKWLVLYYLKTGEAMPLPVRFSIDLLRNSYHYFRHFDPWTWKARGFHLVWRWLTFPFVLPYSVYCKHQFKVMCRKRREKRAAGERNVAHAPIKTGSAKPVFEIRVRPWLPGLPPAYQSLEPFEPYFETGIPVLLYQKIARPTVLNRRKNQYVPRHVFGRQLRELKKAGFKTISLSDLVEQEGQKHRKHVVITFDGGYESAFSQGLKLLAEVDFKATMFLVPKYLGKAKGWETRVRGVEDRLVSQSQVREWLAAGHEIGAQTMTHPMLTRISLERAREEIVSSRQLLEDMFGVHVRHFSYPYGEWDAALAGLVQEAGFETAVTTEFGVNSPEIDRFQIRRISGYVALYNPANWVRFFRVGFR